MIKARYIPECSQKIASRKSSAVVYLHRFAGGKLGAIGYYGKALKPAFNFSFKSAEYRAKWVAEWFAKMDAAEASKQARKAEQAAKMAAGHKLVVGSILRSSWGYDQTNVDYYQVVELVGKRGVMVREIEAESVVDSLGDRGKCVPAPGQFKSEPMRKIVQAAGDSIKIASYANAYLMVPKEVAPGVKVYEASYWSSYA